MQQKADGTCTTAGTNYGAENLAISYVYTYSYKVTMKFTNTCTVYDIQKFTKVSRYT